MAEKWDLSRMNDLSGKTAIVTGANSGLGFETGRALASAGADVVLACRDAGRGASASEAVLLEFPSASVRVMELDLADLSSIRKFAMEFLRLYNNRLNILVNNAGVMMPPYGMTKDGFETQFGTNHLGHFALTGLLLPALKSTPASRVVTVSSDAHRFGSIDFNNLMYEKGGYGGVKAYGRSKLANLLFTYELQRRFEKGGLNCLAAAAHPGVALTNLSRFVGEKGFWRGMRLFMTRFVQPARSGALPIIRAAVDTAVKGGEFYGPSGLMRGAPVRVNSSRASHDAATAGKLWEVSQQLTGVSYL